MMISYKSTSIPMMLSATVSLTKNRSLDRLLQPALKQQDDWFLYFDRISGLSTLEHDDKPLCEFLCVETFSEFEYACKKNFNSLHFKSYFIFFMSHSLTFTSAPSNLSSSPVPPSGEE